MMLGPLAARRGLGPLATGVSGGSVVGPEAVVWQNAVGVTVSGNNLTKTAVNGWNNAGASSTRAIASGDGYMEWTVLGATTTQMVGLSDAPDSTYQYTVGDFKVYRVFPGPGYHVWERNENKGLRGAFPNGALVRVAYESGVVKYYADGVLLYTSLLPPVYPARVWATIYYQNAIVNNAVIYGANLVTL